MSYKRVIHLLGPEQRQRAHEEIDALPRGYVARFTEPAKSRDQEEKYHAMVGDIADQCEFMEMRWSLEDWKRLLVDAFVRVMREQAKAEGKPDPFEGQGRLVPNLDGTGFIQLGVQTRKFTKGIASQFIEYLYAFGSEREVRWSAASRDVMEMLRQPVRRAA